MQRAYAAESHPTKSGFEADAVPAETVKDPEQSEGYRPTEVEKDHRPSRRVPVGFREKERQS